MIIDEKTIIITLAIVGVAGYFGLQLIRSFALSIAQENHDANLAADMSVEAKRARREQEADAAAMAAFAKVEPLLPASVVNKGMSLRAKPDVKVHVPSGGGLQTRPETLETSISRNQEEATLTTAVDEEKPLDQLIAAAERVEDTPADQRVGEEVDEEEAAHRLVEAADNQLQSYTFSNNFNENRIGHIEC